MEKQICPNCEMTFTEQDVTAYKDDLRVRAEERERWFKFQDSAMYAELHGRMERLASYFMYIVAPCTLASVIYLHFFGDSFAVRGWFVPVLLLLGFPVLIAYRFHKENQLFVQFKNNTGA